MGPDCSAWRANGGRRCFLISAIPRRRRSLNFCAIAEGFGYFAQKVANADELKAAFCQARKRESSLIHCIINQDEMVLPMVAPELSIDKIVMSYS